MLKKLLSVVAGLLLTVTCYAAGAEFKDGHPDTYVVVKGDTLWDISGRFLKSPWLWPEVWQANPQIENPHLIYPGDVISLVYLDGKPYLTVSERAFSGPRVRAEALDSAVKPLPLEAIKGFLKKPRLLTDAERRNAPYVLRPEENRLRATAGQLIYVRRLDAKVGDRVAIARPTLVYRDVPAKRWSNTERRTDARDWNSSGGKTIGGTVWDHAYDRYGSWRKYKILGYEVMEIATGEVVRSGDPASILVAFGDMEIKEGDLVLPTDDAPFDMSFVPHAPKSVPDNMRVVALADALIAVGPHQVVALTRGHADGVENGQVYSIFQLGDVVRDRVEYADNDVRTAFRPGRANVTLPEEFVGHVMIFRTFDRISYGLVMDGIRPVQIGDVLHAPAQY